MSILDAVRSAAKSQTARQRREYQEIMQRAAKGENDPADVNRLPELADVLGIPVADVEAELRAAVTAAEHRATISAAGDLDELERARRASDLAAHECRKTLQEKVASYKAKLEAERVELERVRDEYDRRCVVVNQARAQLEVIARQWPTLGVEA